MDELLELIEPEVIVTKLEKQLLLYKLLDYISFKQVTNGLDLTDCEIVIEWSRIDRIIVLYLNDFTQTVRINMRYINKKNHHISLLHLPKQTTEELKIRYLI